MKRRGDDFGSVAIGTPYYRPVYEFFRWWTWLLIDGLEADTLMAESRRRKASYAIGRPLRRVRSR